MPQPNSVRRWRGLALAAAGLYLVSLAILLVASTALAPIAPGQFTWTGVTDVVLAFIVVILAAALQQHAKSSVGLAALRLSYGVATTLPVVLLLAMWVFAAGLRWDVLLVGLAWRLWVLLYTLPSAVALWRPEAPPAAGAQAAPNPKRSRGADL